MSESISAHLAGRLESLCLDGRFSTVRISRAYPIKWLACSIVIASLLVYALPSTGQQAPIAAEPIWAPQQGRFTTSLTWGDVDGDGDLDLVCGVFTGNPLLSTLGTALYLNVNGILSDVPSWVSGPARYDNTNAVALGDLDGDGDLDLACANYNAANHIYRNTNGSFSSYPTWKASNVYRSCDVEMGDIDNDGDLDLVFAHYSSTTTHTIYLNNNGLFPTTPSQILSGNAGYGAWSVALGDINGDGFLDLVSGNHGVNTLRLNHGGYFSTDPEWSSSLAWPTRSIALGDVDGDGGLDLVCGNEIHRNTLYLNIGGTFGAAPAWLSTPAEDTRSVALGDCDGDGDLDLVCGNANESNSIYLNGGTMFSTSPDWQSFTTYDTRSVSLADVDGDGDLDLAEGNYGDIVASEDYYDPHKDRLYLNHCGSFDPVPAWSSGTADHTYAVEAGDIDGDDDTDLVFGNSGQSSKLFINENGIVSPAPSWSSAVDLNTEGVALGDVDGDGDLDLACGNRLQNSTLYRNDGGMFASQPAWSSTPAYRTRSVALGDIDRDGDLDLVCGNWGGDLNALYMGAGGSFSSAPEWLSGGAHNTRSVVLGDIDGDGALDLVCGNDYASNTLFYNQGAGFSSAPAWSSRATDYTESVALGDIDGDGDLDLVCGNLGPYPQGQSNRLYLNDDGVFLSDPAWSSSDAARTSGIDLGDVDNDGDLDLVCGNEGSSSVYKNSNGLFTYDPDQDFGEDMNTLDVRLADVDEDGDLDCITANAFQSSMLYNGLPCPPYKGTLSSPTRHLPNNDAFLRQVRLRHLAPNLYSLRFTAHDVESDPVWIMPEYQYKGAPEWHPMDIVLASPGKTGPFSSSPAGVQDSLLWNVTLMPLDPREVVLRLRVVSIPRRVSQIQHISSYFKSAGVIEPIRPEISISTPSLSFATVTVGDTIFRDFTVRNRGKSPLTVNSIVPPSAEMRQDRTTPFVVSPQAEANVRVYLEPRYQWDIAGDIVIASDDPLAPETRISVATDIRRLQVETALIGFGDTVPLGATVPVIVTPAADVHVEGGSLIYRPDTSGEAPWDSVPLIKHVAGFIAVIPSEAVTEEGVLYYVRVENSGITETDPPGAPSAKRYVLNVEPPGSITSAPVPNEGNDFIEGREVRVYVSLPVGAVFQEGLLYFRPGGVEDYDSLSLEADTRLPFATIPDSLAAARGMEYWVKVRTLVRTLTDPPVAPREHPKAIRVTARMLREKSIRAGSAYRMFSIPLDMKGTIAGALTDNIGLPDETQWRMFLFDPGRAAYTEVPNDSISEFEQGRAYWLITRNPHRLDTGPAEGLSTPTDSAYALVLEPGWNMIGNPFDFGVAWDSIRVRIGEGEVLDMSQAEAAAIDPPVHWDPSEGYRFDVTLLDPFEGYWVRNRGEMPNVLLIPPSEAAAGAFDALPAAGGGDPQTASGETETAARNREAASGETAWSLVLRAASAGNTKGCGTAGVANGAGNRWDRFDRAEPPMNPGAALSLYFPHASWEYAGGSYAVDMRGEPEQLEDYLIETVHSSGGLRGYLWRFDVAKSFSAQPAGDAVTLAFEGVESVPADAEVYLIDSRLARVVDLRREAGYEFFLGRRDRVFDEADARFALLVGSADFIESQKDILAAVPAASALHQNYPNPFNPSTLIRYDVAEPGRVDVRIYDTNGALVRILFSGYREPGRYETGWNGDNERGERVSSGMYYCRLQTSACSESRKMLLIK